MKPRQWDLFWDKDKWAVSTGPLSGYEVSVLTVEKTAYDQAVRALKLMATQSYFEKNDEEAYRELAKETLEGLGEL